MVMARYITCVCSDNEEVEVDLDFMKKYSDYFSALENSNMKEKKKGEVRFPHVGSKTLKTMTRVFKKYETFENTLGQESGNKKKQQSGFLNHDKKFESRNYDKSDNKEKNREKIVKCCKRHEDGESDNKEQQKLEAEKSLLFEVVDFIDIAAVDLDNLLEAADYFVSHSLKQYCIQYMKFTLKETCNHGNRRRHDLVELYSNFSSIFELQLENHIAKVIFSSAPDILDTPEIVCLSDKCLVSVLSELNKYECGEIKKFLVCLNWYRNVLNYDAFNRIFERNIYICNLSRFDMEFIKSKLKEIPLKSLFEKFSIMWQEYTSNSHKFIRTFPIQDVRKKDIILLCFWTTNRNSNSKTFSTSNTIAYMETESAMLDTCECKTNIFCFKVNPKWSPIRPETLTENSVCVLDGFLYVLGGQTRSSDFAKYATNKVLQFDPFKLRWSKVAPMIEKRCLFYAGELNGNIIAVGGYNQQGALSSVECYDPDTESWRYGSSLPHSLHEHSGCKLNDSLYISGGHTDVEITNKMYALDDPLLPWQQKAPMLSERTYHVMAAVNGSIYVLGGCRNINDKIQDCLDCETYNPLTDQWSKVTLGSEADCVSCCVPIVLNECILCIGGYRFGNDTFSEDKPGYIYHSVNIFNVNTGTWSRSDCKLQIGTKTKPMVKGCVSVRMKIYEQKTGCLKFL